MVVSCCKLLMIKANQKLIAVNKIWIKIKVWEQKFCGAVGANPAKIDWTEEWSFKTKLSLRKIIFFSVTEAYERTKGCKKKG